VILKKKAAELRKQTGSNFYFSRQELKNASWWDTMFPILTRPIMMLISEPIILSTAIYISLAYSLVFFFFQAYPIIYEGMYQLSEIPYNVNNSSIETYSFDVQTTSLIYIPSMYSLNLRYSIISNGKYSWHWRCLFRSGDILLRHYLRESQKAGKRMDFQS
jgi:hypothetical protein